jgi:hypothetical protein
VRFPPRRGGDGGERGGSHLAYWLHGDVAEAGRGEGRADAVRSGEGIQGGDSLRPVTEQPNAVVTVAAASP